MIDLATIRSYDLYELSCFYKEVLEEGNQDQWRWLCRNDRFFLLTCILRRRDALRQWILERCREVEAEPEGYLDLWSRYHYKSTLITLAGAVQEILIDPEITIGIFSHTIVQSRAFVDQIRRALEDKDLVRLFPDILHAKPPQLGWSTRDGLIVKRKDNPKERTVQPAGLVDGQPTGAHFALRIYDDIVTRESVGTMEQIEKTTAAWELSLALGTLDGGRAWYAGTRYHPNDTYHELLARGALKERRRLCIDDNGDPVLMTREALDELRAAMGDRTFGAQMLQRPTGAGVRLFKDEWQMTVVDEYVPSAKDHHRYILVDTANSKKKGSDYTVMIVVGLAKDSNYWVHDAIRDRLNLAERTRIIFELVERWTPKMVFWEQTGAQADIEHLKEKMKEKGWHFPITPLHQSIPKPDRIEWLVPVFEQLKLWMPARLLKRTVEGVLYDWVERFTTTEYSSYPICAHDDMLDCLANIKHPAFIANANHPISPLAEAHKWDKETHKASYYFDRWGSR